VVGSTVVRHLVEAGHEVWALARSAASSDELDDLGASVVHGDILDRDSVGRLVKGSRRVFHIAGVNELCSRDPKRMWMVNVDATVGVIETAARAGVERMILTSSAVTIGEERGQTGNEASRHRGHFLSEYERSKTVAERLAFDTVHDIEIVSVNPSSVQGPGRSTGTGALLLAAARRRLPFLVDSTISLVDIDDCARGHLLAADHGVPGERYILSGAVLTVREAMCELNRRMGRRDTTRYLNPTVVTAAAPVVDALCRVAGRQPPLCSESARVLLHGHRYDGSRAVRDLGLEYTSIGKTIERTVAWFRAEGLI
jgi:dihydroflavonol-4-reductase